jgi:predicted SAM-dependent methyltransferase
MLKKECINFDNTDFAIGDLQTDVLGDILELERIFQPETFVSIFCAHVIEHFFPDQAKKMLADCYSILIPTGSIVFEGPDIEKIIRRFTSEELVREIYGVPLLIKQYGEGWGHKWGWTQETAARAMEDAGFEIRFKGNGVSHNKPERDFRVEGVKL